MTHSVNVPARIVAGLALLIAGAGLTSTAAAQTPPAQSATVTLSDTGISPASVTIAAGGSVTWINKGNVTHNAESTGGPSAFNTAGIGSGQSATLAFAGPGIYAYTAGTDCLHGAFIAAFTCGDYTIVVLEANGGLPAMVGSPTSTPVTPVQTGPLASAGVTVTDTAFAPATADIGLNGSVTWTNTGAHVHSATSTPDSVSAGLPFFDTGGLGPGQAKSSSFATPGTYVYSSAPDCFPRSSSPQFNCAYYAVIVESTPPAQQSSTAEPTATPAAVPGATASVIIDDINGFQPNTLTVKAGQSVGWLNLGRNSHSVVMNQNPQPNQPPPWWLPYQVPSVGGVSFDSGGLNPQRTFTFAFPAPGTFPYHSSTEPVYLQNYVNCGCTFTTYKFFGTVTVTP